MGKKKENKVDEKETMQDEKTDNSEAPANEETVNEDKKENNTNEDEIARLNGEIENLNNKLVRLQADFLNYKNRTEKEKTATYNNAVADLLTEILPVVDNFERAIETTSGDDANFRDGIKMIYNQFITILQKKGLTEVEALNSKFDPNLHFGVAFDSDSDKEEETVIEVFQKGYKVNDKVVRPSMVKIARK